MDTSRGVHPPSRAGHVLIRGHAVVTDTNPPRPQRAGKFILTVLDVPWAGGRGIRDAPDEYAVAIPIASAARRRRRESDGTRSRATTCRYVRAPTDAMPSLWRELFRCRNPAVCPKCSGRVRPERAIGDGFANAIIPAFPGTRRPITRRGSRTVALRRFVASHRVVVATAERAWAGLNSPKPPPRRHGERLQSTCDG